MQRGGTAVVFTPESLERMSRSAAGTPVTMNHNPLLMPLGKMERVCAEQNSEGQTVLRQTSYLVTDDPEPFTHHPSSADCVRVTFGDAVGRFSLHHRPDGPLMSVDISALREGGFAALEEEIRTQPDNITVGFHDRQEAIPIPLVELVMSMPLQYLLKVALGIAVLRAASDGTLARWAEETVKWVKNTCVPALQAYRQHKNDDAIDHKIDWLKLKGYVQEADGLLVELVIPSGHTTDLSEDFVEPFIEQVKAFSDLHTECDKMVFAYFPEERRCEFRYALTKSGDVIGSQSCYEESVQPHRLMLMSTTFDTNIGWTLVTRENGQLGMNLYSIVDYPPEYLGCLTVEPEQAATFQEMGVLPDDGVLRPFRREEDGRVRLL